MPGDHVKGAGGKDLVERYESVAPRSQGFRKGGFRVADMTRYQIGRAKPVSEKADPPHRYINKRTLNVGGRKKLSSSCMVAYGVDPGFLNAWCPQT